MGGAQSRLHVYFGNKNNTYGSYGYVVKSSKKVLADSINFEVVTHYIYITDNFDTYYDVYLYNFRFEQEDSDYIFAYCSPSDYYQVIDIVNVYYSVLAPNDPLVISFITKGHEIYNCEYSKLLSARWDYASNISKYNFTEDISKKLSELYIYKSLNAKIKFKIGGQKFVKILESKQEIANRLFFRIVYTPKGKESILSNDYLYKSEIDIFTSKCIKLQNQSDFNDPKYNNQIDPYYLDSVKGHYFDGIIVYFARDYTNDKENNRISDRDINNNMSYYDINEINKNNMLVLLEFIGSYKIKTHIRRKDIYGYCWAEGEVEYFNDSSLEEALKTIKESAEKNESITFILEKTSNYKGVTVSEIDKNKITYIKYEHKAVTSEKSNIVDKKVVTKSERPNIIFERELVAKIGDFNLDFNTTNLDVYFLKTTTTTDDWPFILMFKNEYQTSKNRCFYFSNTYNFEEWYELTVNETSQERVVELDRLLEEKLNEKLEQIEENESCHSDLHLLRREAFYILNTDIDWILIIGIIIACILVLGTIGAIIYGIYWYNTTIKLLT